MRRRDDDEDARARGGKGDVDVVQNLLSVSLKIAFVRELFKRRSVSLSLSRFCRFDRSRSRERERKRAHAALASGCFLSSSFSSNWNVVTLISSLQSFSLCERTIFTTDDDM